MYLEDAIMQHDSDIHFHHPKLLRGYFIYHFDGGLHP